MKVKNYILTCTVSILVSVGGLWISNISRKEAQFGAIVNVEV